MNSDPIRVLLIDDDEDYCILTREALSEINTGTFQVDWVATYEAGLEAIGRNQHNVCILDYRLGQRNGLELLREALRNGARAPIILLTGQGDRDVDIEAMRAGAADYLSKDRMDAFALERSIRYAIERKRNEEALHRIQSELEKRVQERTAELADSIHVLREEIAEHMRTEEELEASLKEKEVLLREVHHRVKNNLQVVCSLLAIQSKHIADQNTLQVFRESQNRVRSLAIVHERLYRGANLARIDFADYVRSLTGSLFRSYGVNPDNVRLRIQADDIVLGIDTVIPCALIVNELVTNALKHAFPDGKGEISIELVKDDQETLTLTVRDDGGRFPKDWDLRSTESVGLQIVNALVDQLEGTFDWSCNGATDFKVSFKNSGMRKG